MSAPARGPAGMSLCPLCDQAIDLGPRPAATSTGSGVNSIPTGHERLVRRLPHARNKAARFDAFVLGTRRAQPGPAPPTDSGTPRPRCRCAPQSAPSGLAHPRIGLTNQLRTHRQQFYPGPVGSVLRPGLVRGSASRSASAWASSCRAVAVASCRRAVSPWTYETPAATSAATSSTDRTVTRRRRRNVSWRRLARRNSADASYRRCSLCGTTGCGAVRDGSAGVSAASDVNPDR